MYEYWHHIVDVDVITYPCLLSNTKMVVFGSWGTDYRQNMSTDLFSIIVSLPISFIIYMYFVRNDEQKYPINHYLVVVLRVQLT